MIRVKVFTAVGVTNEIDCDGDDMDSLVGQYTEMLECNGLHYMSHSTYKDTSVTIIPIEACNISAIDFRRVISEEEENE